jgi:hypothetical protein
MPVALYMDAHIPRAVTVGLRLRGVDVLTAQEDKAATLADSQLLDRAASLGRVLFTFDDDLLVEATKRQAEGIRFSGVVYAHPMRVSIGTCIRGLEVIAKTTETADWESQIVFLPLRY